MRRLNAQRRGEQEGEGGADGENEVRSADFARKLKFWQLLR